MARRARKYQTELNFSSKEDRDVQDVLLAWEQARQAKARQEMAANAHALGERRFFSAPDGFGGEIQMMVHPESFHHWGQKVGYACWSDDAFKREYHRDNPSCRVKNHARETTVSVPETSPLATAAKRFTKNYG